MQWQPLLLFFLFLFRPCDGGVAAALAVAAVELVAQVAVDVGLSVLGSTLNSASTEGIGASSTATTSQLAASATRSSSTSSTLGTTRLSSLQVSATSDGQTSASSTQSTSTSNAATSSTSATSSNRASTTAQSSTAVSSTSQQSTAVTSATLAGGLSVSSASTTASTAVSQAATSSTSASTVLTSSTAAVTQSTTSASTQATSASSNNAATVTSSVSVVGSSDAATQSSTSTSRSSTARTSSSTTRVGSTTSAATRQTTVTARSTTRGSTAATTGGELRLQRVSPFYECNEGSTSSGGLTTGLYIASRGPDFFTLVGRFDAGTHSDLFTILLSKLHATTNSQLPPPAVSTQFMTWVDLFCANDSSEVRPIDTSFTQATTALQGSISCNYKPLNRKIFFTVAQQLPGFIDVLFFDPSGNGPFILSRLPGVDTGSSQTISTTANAIFVEQQWISLLCGENLETGISIQPQASEFNLLNSTIITCDRNSETSTGPIKFWFELRPPYWTVLARGSGISEDGSSDTPVVLFRVADHVNQDLRNQAITDATLNMLSNVHSICHNKGGVAKVCDGVCFF